MRTSRIWTLLLASCAVGCASLNTGESAAGSPLPGTRSDSLMQASKPDVTAAKPEEAENAQNSRNPELYAHATRQPGDDDISASSNVIDVNAIGKLVWDWYKAFEYERIIEFSRSIRPQVLGHGCSAVSVYVVIAASAFLLGEEGIAREWILRAKATCPGYVPEPNSFPIAFCVLYTTARP